MNIPLQIELTFIGNNEVGYLKYSQFSQYCLFFIKIRLVIPYKFAVFVSAGHSSYCVTIRKL